MPLPDCPLFQGPFVFLRHGETESNRLGLTTGMSDITLNARGREQIRTVAATLAHRGIDSIYSSPLKRALESARYVAETVKLAVITIPELAERNWGIQEGRPRTLRTREGRPPGGESLEEFTQRTMRGLAKIPGGGLPLIVGHSGTFRVLCAHFQIEFNSQVENCRPLRFSPPDTRGGLWSLTPL